MKVELKKRFFNHIKQIVFITDIALCIPNIFMILQIYYNTRLFFRIDVKC